jgi:hypothetical protein
MVDESVKLSLTLLTFLVGLGLLLLGVYQTHGASVNAIMGVGGAFVVAATGYLSVWAMGLDDVSEGHAH